MELSSASATSLWSTFVRYSRNKSNVGYRLAIAFADVGRYSKPQLSLMPHVDTTLC